MTLASIVHIAGHMKHTIVAVIVSLAALFTVAGCAVDDLGSEESELNDLEESPPGFCPTCAPTMMENWNNYDRCGAACQAPLDQCDQGCWAGPDDQEEACVANCLRTWAPCHCACALQAVECGLRQQHAVQFWCSNGGQPNS